LVNRGDISHEKSRYNSGVMEECSITGSVDPDVPKMPCFLKTSVTKNSETGYRITADPNAHRHAVQSSYLGAISGIFRMIAGEPAEYTDPSYKHVGEVASINGN
jgi:hypothetical protein